jgi:DNA/RNA endonuclease YhcR with UshA esterase domain
VQNKAANTFQLFDPDGCQFSIDSGRVKTISGISQANPGVITSSSHGFVDGDIVTVKGVVGMAQLNAELAYQVQVHNTNSFSLLNLFDGDVIDTRTFTAYSNGGTVSYGFKPYLSGGMATSGTVVTAPTHAMSNGDVVRIQGVYGSTEANGHEFTVNSVATGTLTISSITQATIAEATTSSAHSLKNGQRITITAVSPSAYNGVYEVDVTAATTFYLRSVSLISLSDFVSNQYFDSSGLVSMGTGGTIHYGSFELLERFSRSQSTEVYSISSASEALVTSYGHTLATDDVVMIKGVLGSEGVNGVTYKVSMAGCKSSSAAITGITVATPAVVTAPGHGYQTGDKVQIGNIEGMGMAQLQTVVGNTGRPVVMDQTFTVGTTTTDTIELRAPSAGVMSDFSTVMGSSTWSAYHNLAFEYTSGGTLYKRIRITGITHASPAVVTTQEAHSLADGDKVFIDGIVGMTQLNRREFTVHSPGTVSFSLRDASDNANIDSGRFATVSAYTFGDPFCKITPENTP